MLSKNNGFTLMELLLTMAIMGILATMAVPAMNSFFSSSKVAGLAERVQADIEWARSQAIVNPRAVNMTLNTVNWCYGFDDDADNNPATVCDCTNPASCTVQNIQKVVSVASYANTTLATSLAGNTMTFERSGYNNNANQTITISGGGSTAVLNITPLGRGNLCSNDLPQYTACN